MGQPTVSEFRGEDRGALPSNTTLCRSRIVGPLAVAKKVLSYVLPNISEIVVKASAEMEIRATPQTSERDSGTGKADIGILRTKLVNIEGRLEAEESGSVAQAELIVQLTNHNAALARGVLILAGSFNSSLSLQGRDKVGVFSGGSQRFRLPAFHPHPSPLPQGRGRIKRPC